MPETLIDEEEGFLAQNLVSELVTIEEIPNDNKLLYRVHKSVIKNGSILPVAIKMRGDGDSRGMSTDWEKYSTPEKLKDIAKTPSDNGIISFVTGIIRNTGVAMVKHDPIANNRAHTHVLWEDVNETQVRQQLSKTDSYEWEINYP